MALNSPDLSPLDYAGYDWLCSRAYHTPISSLDDFKDRVCTCWENLDQEITDKSIDHWHDKLKAVVRLNGGHI